MKRLLLGLLFLAAGAGAKESPFEGTWSFQLPDYRPVWLKVSGETEVELLWSVGSAKPTKDVWINHGVLAFQRKFRWKPYGNEADLREVIAPVYCTVSKKGDMLMTVRPTSGDLIVLTGKKMPPPPKKPVLDQVRFGPPISLIERNSLTGWKLFNSNKKNGWWVEDGILINETPKKDFSGYGEFGNLVTERHFGDFRLSIEYNVPPAGNSGIYLRGAYEAQVVDKDSRMQGIIGPGAIFGRIAPSENAGKAGGEWNRYVLTLVDQHITVELNGKTVIDNQLIEGCTG
ncbi:MAG: DUF1080 domain-containing protein, partial [Verrucomicrobiota bacterium]